MSQVTIACGETENDKATRFDRPPRISIVSFLHLVRVRERKKGKRSRTRNHMERDAHNCARVMGPLGYLKRRPLPNDTNYAINVPRVRFPPCRHDSLSQHSQPRPHVTTPACITTLKWSVSYNTASQLSLGSVARAISGSG